MATRRVTFRLYPKPSAENKLYWARKMYKELYNTAIANRKTQYERFGQSVSYYEQQNSLPAFKEVWTEYKQLGSQTLQATIKRVDLAYQSFFKGLRGKPKFKSLRRQGSRGEGSRGETWIKLALRPSLGVLERRCSEPMFRSAPQQEGRACSPAPCSLSPLPLRSIRHYSGWTYPATSGWKVHTTGDNGYLELTDLKLSKKKVKASKRWKKASKRVSRLQRNVANQRQDWTHKVANQIVSGNSLVATEELNLKGMTRKAKKGSKRKAQKTGLNRSMLDVGIVHLTKAIEYKLQQAGGFLVKVPTKTVKPSQTCPCCGHQCKKDLSERVHHCSECGALYDRDVAAAMVMLSWALGTSVLKRGEEIPTSESQHTGGWKQISSLKRKKLVDSRNNGE